ncbi:hypothetical protein [Roseibium sp. Sym1]|uniref:hypothetical protein n=1 Tax=Roseibium sp. Sym1 TaxID=3016006 RepID=UPI0022B3A047|nr:hypothetical protein [Roseibium sp. Sym1]
MSNIELYREFSLRAACECRLRAEGIEFETACPQAEFVKLCQEHAALSKVSLELYGYDSSVSEKLPGYAEINYRGYVVFVPYTVAIHFPTPSKFERIFEMALQISVNLPCQILVSGSGVLGGAIYTLGDLDYCEYFQRFDGAYINNLSRKACVEKIDDVLLPVYVKWNGRRLSWPFDEIDALLNEARSSFAMQSTEALENWKVDYVGQIAEDVILPVTNMCIPVEFDNWNATAVGKSWAFQEVLISSNGNPPRDLTTFNSLGSYVNWLRSEVAAHLAKKNFLKATKRAFSLANVTFRFDISQSLAEILCRSAITQHTQKKALEETQHLLEQRGNPECALLRKVQDSLSLISETNRAELDDGFKRCFDLVNGFLSEFDSELARYKAQY